MSLRIFITGGASGLGQALALYWADKGHRVAIGDIQPGDETLARISKRGGEGLYLPCDVTDEDQLKLAAEAVERRWGGLDLLVNNAGVATAGTLTQEDLDQWRWVLDINLLGVVRGCRAFLPLLEQSQGQILNVGSQAGLNPMPRMGSYSAAKAAVVAFSESLALELADKGVGVSVACPNFFKTGLGDTLRSPDPNMTKVVNRLFDKAPLSAEQVAAHLAKGVAAGRFLLMPHLQGRQAHWAKRLLPRWAYEKLMLAQTARLRQMP